jgi:hypothetical protein
MLCLVIIPEKSKIDVSCFRDVEIMAEKMISTKSWNKSTDKMRIRPNPSLNTNQKKSQKMIKNKILPLLKNGSLRTPSGELKSCMVKNFGQVILCNTCAFDTIASILMVTNCDSVNYNIAISGKEIVFMKFITGIVKNGISAKTYSIRAEILVCL